MGLVLGLPFQRLHGHRILAHTSERNGNRRPLRHHVDAGGRRGEIFKRGGAERCYAGSDRRRAGHGNVVLRRQNEEVAKPGYYSVPLTRYGISAEMTATTRVGLSRYTFPASDSSAVVFDLENGGCWDKAYDTKFTVVDSCTIDGYRFSTGWAKDQKIYFRAQFSKPSDSFDEVAVKEYAVDGQEYSVNYFRAGFRTTEGEQVMVKVAVSPVSEEKAALNMSAELPGWDFDATAVLPARPGTPNSPRQRSRLLIPKPEPSSTQRFTTR